MTILHISDLHFAADLFSPTHWLQKVHGPRLLDALSRYWERRPTDYLVVTGDISTDGELQSLKNARGFLMDRIPVNGAEWQGVAEIGLDVHDPDRLFLVPGNHDRYAWRGLGISGQVARFEEVFGDMFHNKGRPRRAGWMGADGLRVRVLSIDSMGKARKFSPAAGRVHEDDMEWLRQVYREDCTNQEKWDLRLLLLHHHVALPDTREFSRFTKLDNRAELLEDMLRGDIDLVMYGHEHYRYLGDDTYRELITDKRRRRALSKNGYQLSKNLAVCMCGTTTVDNGNDSSRQNLAWRVTIDRQGVEQYSIAFELLELDGLNRELRPVPGEAKVVSFRRKSCREER